MGSTSSGPVAKLSEIRKRRIVQRVFGSDKPHTPKLLIGGVQHRARTIWFEGPKGSHFEVDYVPVKAQEVAPRKPEDRKPTGFKRQCRTRWDKR